MKVLAVKRNADDYQFLVHTGDKDTAMDFYNGSKVETKLVQQRTCQRHLQLLLAQSAWSLGALSQRYNIITK